MGDLAEVLIEWIPGRRGHLAVYDVHVDGRPVGRVNQERLVAVPVWEGRHQVFLQIGRLRSDVVELDLAGGEVVHLTCGLKPLIQNPFFRFFEAKMLFLAMPVAVAAYFVPPVMHFIERHLAVEFLGILFLWMLGFLVSLPRIVSRRPGAMIYLVVRPDAADRLESPVP
ncbi:hypothetical protein OJF2_30620 [Aquisphaera giovannonii]|uniref:Uncharacterized protein n=1 Tax=Aquisphaera giovannonii TaxID=406548 RepID=A0A5B9W1J4_9BACT|nr:hypothetical protein [Aquisphaera giovannonii]QEH34522.1 hypothetical protein OJF2_30620 [Aquisphaera giovannonii]